MDTLRKTKNFLFLLLAIFGVIGCANEQPPSGGPPDKEPPKVLSFEPKQMTRNFDSDRISVEFSEYVNKASVAENIFITPRLPFEVDWSGRYLEVVFTEKPEKNTTYTVSLGGDYTDLKSNKPTESFSLTFSTGDVIDSGTVKGRVFHDSPAGIFLFLYPLASINPDTLNPSTKEPRYIAQAGTSGDFTFYALPDGNYRLMAVKDAFKDRLYNEGVDGYGSPWKNVTVEKAKSGSIILRCDEVADIVSPTLSNVEAISSRMIALDFGEEIDSSVLRTENFIVSDSMGSRNNPIEYVYPNPKNSKNILVITKNALDTGIVWKVNVDTSVRDMRGNKITDTLRSKIFRGSSDEDNTKPTLLSVSISDSAKNITTSGELKIVFSKAVDTNSVMSAISLSDIASKKTEVVSYRWKNPSQLLITSQQELKPNSWYEYEVIHGNIIGWNSQKMKDSTHRIRFKTIDTREYGSLKGSFFDSVSVTGGRYVLLITPKNGRSNTKPYKIVLEKSGTWSIDKLPAGNYLIGAFHDENNNGIYDFGKPFPYTLAERFIPNPVEVTVKARWVVEGVKVTMGK